MLPPPKKSIRFFHKLKVLIDENRTIVDSINRIAKLTGTSNLTTLNGIRELVEFGIIKKTKTTHLRKGRVLYAYSLNKAVFENEWLDCIFNPSHTPIADDLDYIDTYIYYFIYKVKTPSGHVYNYDEKKIAKETGFLLKHVEESITHLVSKKLIYKSEGGRTFFGALKPIFTITHGGGLLLRSSMNNLDAFISKLCVYSTQTCSTASLDTSDRINQYNSVFTLITHSAIAVGYQIFEDSGALLTGSFCSNTEEKKLVKSFLSKVITDKPKIDSDEEIEIYSKNQRDLEYHVLTLADYIFWHVIKQDDKDSKHLDTNSYNPFQNSFFVYDGKQRTKNLIHISFPTFRK